MEANVQEIWVEVMLRHVFYGVFFWEFFTTLDYEWKVIRGRIPYRWTIWIYSVSRLACFVALIISAVRINATTPFNCQVLVSLDLVFASLAFAAASLLIVLRISAIWNRNKDVMALATSVWAINIGFLIQDAVLSRTIHSSLKLLIPPLSCMVEDSLSNRLVLISMAATDIILLLIMLMGLLRMRHDGYATFGLAQLLWKQGVIWILLATLVEIPPAISALLNLAVRDTAVTYLMAFRPQGFGLPTFVTMIIAATRMHRSLVVFATPDDVTDKNLQISGLRFLKTKRTRAAPIPPNPMVTSVRNVSQQNQTREMIDDGVSESINMGEDVYGGPNGSTFEEGIERSE